MSEASTREENNEREEGEEIQERRGRGEVRTRLGVSEGGSIKKTKGGCSKGEDRIRVGRTSVTRKKRDRIDY